MTDQTRVESDALADALGKHVFLRGFTTIDGPQKSRCTCGYAYDNPNASEGFSHPRHVAGALIADGWVLTLSPGAPE